MSIEIIYIVIAIIAAIVGDLWLMRRWQRLLPRDEPSREPEVRVFGHSSPILTWLKYRTWRSVQFRLDLKALRPSSTALELGAIVMVAVVYAHPLLDFDPYLTLPGIEYHGHVGVVVPFIQWLRGGEFPLWNPIIGNGRSWIADPFLYAFNPFLSLPMALMGVINGSKVAVILNLIVAGVGVWVLCQLMGLGGVARVWCSALYLMSGGLSAPLIAGQIQLTFALGWLPWSLVGLVAVVKRPGWRIIALASLAQALFYFTGNLYHQLYGLACLVVMTVVYIVELKSLRVRWDVAGRIALVGLASLGLIAIQLLPQLASIPSIHNTGGYPPGSTDFAGSQSPQQALMSYVSPDQLDSLIRTGLVQEFHHYIGIASVLLLPFLVSAWRRLDRKDIVVCALCFLLMLAWACLRYSFMAYVYRAVPFLYHFRWPSRALSVGALFLILLGGMGLDALWSAVRPSVSRARPSLLRASASAILIVGIGLAWRDVYLTNQKLVYLRYQIAPEADAVLSRLRTFDPGDYTIHATHWVVSYHGVQAYELGLRFAGSMDGWQPKGATSLVGRGDAIKLRSQYWITLKGERIDAAQAEQVDQVRDLQVWRVSDSFPYAFLVQEQRLLRVAPPIAPQEIVPASARRDGPNRVIVQAEVTEPSFLVISESWFSDWRVTVDGYPQTVVSVSNLLAVRVQPGYHQVVFEYAPPSFTWGAVISGLTLVLLTAGIFYERRKRARQPLVPARQV